MEKLRRKSIPIRVHLFPPRACKWHREDASAVKRHLQSLLAKSHTHLVQTAPNLIHAA